MLPKGLFLLCLGVFPLSANLYILDDDSTSDNFDASRAIPEKDNDKVFIDPSSLFDRTRRGRIKGGKPSDIPIITEIRMRKSDRSFPKMNSVGDDNFVLSDVRMKKLDKSYELDGFRADIQASITSLIDFILASVSRRSEESREKNVQLKPASKRLVSEVRISDIRMKRDNLTGSDKNVDVNGDKEMEKKSLMTATAPGKDLDEYVRFSDIRMKRNRLLSPPDDDKAEAHFNPVLVSTGFNIELFPLFDASEYVSSRRSKRSVRDEERIKDDPVQGLFQVGNYGYNQEPFSRVENPSWKPNWVHMKEEKRSNNVHEMVLPSRNMLGHLSMSDIRMKKQMESSLHDRIKKKGKAVKVIGQFPAKDVTISDVRMKKKSGIRQIDNLVPLVMSDVRMKKGKGSDSSAFSSMRMSDIRMKKNNRVTSEEWFPSSQMRMSDIRMKKSNGITPEDWLNSNQMRMSDIRMKKNTRITSEELSPFSQTRMSDVRMKKSNEVTAAEDWFPSNHMRMSDIRMKKDNKVTSEEWSPYNQLRMSDVRMKKNNEITPEDWFPYNQMRMSDIRMKKYTKKDESRNAFYNTMMSDVRMKKKKAIINPEEKVHFDKNFIMSDIRMKKKKSYDYDDNAKSNSQDWLPTNMDDVGNDFSDAENEEDALASWKAEEK